MSDRRAQITPQSSVFEALRQSLHEAVDMADSVVESKSLAEPFGPSAKVVAVQIPVEEWGALCAAVREVLARG